MSNLKNNARILYTALQMLKDVEKEHNGIRVILQDEHLQLLK